MTILGIKFSLAKPKRKDHLIVCFIAIVIITIIDIYTALALENHQNHSKLYTTKIHRTVYPF